MKCKLLALLLAYPILSTAAHPNDCSATKATTLPANTTVFAYQAIKNNQTFFIPFAALVDGKLTESRTIQLPSHTKLYNLRNDQAINVNFKNEHDNVDYDVCRSIGKADTPSTNQVTVFATSPIAKEFNFTPDVSDLENFNANTNNPFAMISKPCKNHQPHYDKNGIMTCYADALIATSHFNGNKQYWHTKQYRHDLGFAISTASGKTVTQVIEDCAICKD